MAIPVIVLISSASSSQCPSQALLPISSFVPADFELEHPDNWGSLQDWEPPEDSDDGEPLGYCEDDESHEDDKFREDLEFPEEWEHPDRWQLPGKWELPDDWELLDDWREYGLEYGDFIKKSQLTKSKHWSPKTYVSPPPGSALSAPDWTMCWLPLVSKLVSCKVRRENIKRMFNEVFIAPDALDSLKIVRREFALTWTPSPDYPGFYLSMDKRSGAIGA
ncbi:hypothetical protein EST38_g9305 [Candolleomyces aberdarensis]|uniref:Uncharacterized protein n=1 Tax=Candolleomyces aberdarensis TaxID=2316362 RepID=A0A4Q2DA93_9AGAR|nr:hypothetical protein EST38_g9305 [Candolleomyces aberdarensis]